MRSAIPLDVYRLLYTALLVVSPVVDGWASSFLVDLKHDLCDVVFCPGDLPVRWIQTGLHQWSTSVAMRNGLGCWFPRCVINRTILETGLQSIFISYQRIVHRSGFWRQLIVEDSFRKSMIVHSNNMSRPVLLGPHHECLNFVYMAQF